MRISKGFILSSSVGWLYVLGKFFNQVKLFRVAMKIWRCFSEYFWQLEVPVNAGIGFSGVARQLLRGQQNLVCPKRRRGVLMAVLRLAWGSNFSLLDSWSPTVALGLCCQTSVTIYCTRSWSTFTQSMDLLTTAFISGWGSFRDCSSFCSAFSASIKQEVSRMIPASNQTFDSEQSCPFMSEHLLSD